MSKGLQDITVSDVSRSDNSPPTYTTLTAKVVSIHDGDTCDLVVARYGSFERFKCRLAAINTPELSEGTKAKKARDFLAWLCLGKDPSNFPRSSPPWSDAELQSKLDANKQLVYAEFQGTGGYQRPLVVLRKSQSQGKSFNDLLIDYGYATRYR